MRHRRAGPKRAAVAFGLVALVVLVTAREPGRAGRLVSVAAPGPTVLAEQITTSTTAAPTSTTAGRDPLLGDGEAVTFAFAGDIGFSEGQMPGRLAADPSTAIGPFASVLSGADVAIGNLETSLGTHGSPEAKEFAYQAPPSAVDALRAAGFDAVSMANNHGRDYGPDGLADSLAIRAAQPDGFIIGIGADDTDAYRPFRTTVRGQRIAVIAATQVIDGELVSAWTAAPGHPGLASAKEVDALVAAVAAARRDSDTVVVFLHWGVERATCPSTSQQDLARRLADAGADIVIGGHAHRLQGAGFLGRTFVGYGLGNFDFYAADADAARTGVVQVTMTGHRVDGYSFVPGTVDGAVATPLTGAAADTAIAAWHAQRDCTALTTTASG